MKLRDIFILCCLTCGLLCPVFAKPLSGEKIVFSSVFSHGNSSAIRGSGQPKERKCFRLLCTHQEKKYFSV